MSKPNPISVHPDSKVQKQQIVSQARKQDESVSEYCLLAIEQRLARETEAERVDELEIETRLEDLKTDLIQGIAAATDIDTRQKECYEVALWELLAHRYSPERRRKAMEKAPGKFDEQFESIAEKEFGDKQ